MRRNDVQADKNIRIGTLLIQLSVTLTDPCVTAFLTPGHRLQVFLDVLSQSDPFIR